MHALIIGGGIAGSVTAMALQQVGIEASLFESHPPTDPDVGSWLAVTANGLDGLREIGALELATSAGSVTRRNVLWNHAGRRLATVSLESRLPDGQPARTIKRSRLARALQDEAIRRGLRVDYGRRLRDVRMSPDQRVTAAFDDGSEIDGDLLIGADGVHSVVRRIIDPAAPPARYVGLTNFGGLTRGAGRGFEGQAWHMTFGRRAFFGYHATSAGDVVWFVNLPRPAISPEERATTSADAWRRRLVEAFRDDAGPAAGLVEAGELELVADNTVDLGHVPTWHRDRLVIIGDAAHAPSPSSGQGASMAIEDGIVLARALHEHRSIPEAFKAYERLRRERVERIVAWGAQSSSNKIPGRFGRAVRDLMLPLLFRFVVTETSLAWMYDYRVRNVSRLEISAAAQPG